MKALATIFYLFINGNFGEDNLVKIAPSHSSTVLNGQVYFYQPAFYSRNNNMKACLFLQDLYRLWCLDRHFLVKPVNELFDYQFLTPSGPLKPRSSVFAFGSLKYSHLGKANITVSSRLSLINNDQEAYKKEYPFMKEPFFSNFPDIEYSALLIGEPDMYKSASEANLYILGGAKYYSTNKTIQMINSFFSYSFSKNEWDDLSDKLPKDYESVAGHKMININNEKLVVLGGYRASNYTFNDNLTAINPQFSSFKKILVFDMNEQRWEYKSTELSEQDGKMLGMRKQYSCTTAHRNNNLYVYPGFYTESKNRIVHLFGVLDLDHWSWRWKKVQVDSLLYGYLNNAINFDSMIFEKYMVVLFSNKTADDGIEYLSFDLDSEEPAIGLIPNTYDLRMKPQYKPHSVGYETFIIIMIITSVIILMIFFLLYRYYKHNREIKGLVPRFTTDQIWSDSDIEPNNNRNDFLYGESLGYTNDYENIEQFNNSTAIKVPEFEREKQSDWNENTICKPLTRDSNHLFQTSSTLIRPSMQQHTQHSKDSSSKHKWDPYSTY